jgi:hypothetical protein
MARPGMTNDRGGTDHQQLAQAFVAGLADPAQALLAAGGVFLRRQTQPRGQVPPRGEVARLDRQGQGDGCDGANAWNLGQQLADRVGLVQGKQFVIQSGYLLVQGRNVAPICANIA